MRSGAGTGPSGPGLELDGLVHDGEGVLVDVLVVVVLVRLEAQRGNLRQHLVREAGSPP